MEITIFHHKFPFPTPPASIGLGALGDLAGAQLLSAAIYVYDKCHTQSYSVIPETNSQNPTAQTTLTVVTVEDSQTTNMDPR